MPYVHATVEQGKLRGIDSAGVIKFLGVPYGASTAGENRFRPPQPVTRWGGVRDALTFGPAAPQPDLRLSASARLGRLLTLLSPRAGSQLEGAAIDEDCLRLNIWAPSGRQDDALPVLVWLHGGGYTFGSGNEMAFHGDILAAAGELVVVTVTHRLGLLGFLDLRDLGVAGSANAGILDVAAALEWVQQNIGAFGGDPARVTICGQSGGSGKVAALNAMTRARDLFSRSIMMSGPFGRSNSPTDAAGLRERVMNAAGFSSVEDLRAAPVDHLLEVQAGVRKGQPRTEAGDVGSSLELDSALTFGPGHDPDDLPGNSFGTEATDGIRGKKLLIGWTTHEPTFFLIGDPSFDTTMNPDQAASRVDALPGGDGVTYSDLAAQYPHEQPHLLVARRMSTLMFEKPARRIADLAAAKADGVWAYEFRQPTEVLGGLLGATHSQDLAFVFGTVDRIPMTGRSLDRHDVSRTMMQAWAAFARDGDPGWNAWTTTRTVHAFGTPHGPALNLPDEVDMSRPLQMP